MAKFSFSRVLSLLKGFLREMQSPLYGYDIQDVKLNTNEDSYAALFQFKASTGSDKLGKVTNIKGEDIPLSILIKVINSKEVFAPILSGLNNITTSGNDKETKDLFNLLLGDRDPNGEYKIDNTLESAKARGKDGSMKGGLLGIDLTKVKTLPTAGLTYANRFWSWQNIAEQFLRYSLECEAQGKDYGAIENQAYKDCSKLISEYLAKVELVASPDEVKIDTYPLVLPILVAIQGKLQEYYSAAYEKYDDAKYIEPTFEDLVDEDEYNQAQQEQAAKEQAQAEQAQADNLLNNAETANFRPGPSATQGKGMFNNMQIKVKLQKIQGSEDLSVLGLQSTCPPANTLDYIDDIINQEEFWDAITEEPQTFAINVEDDGYEIEQCEDCEFDPCDSLQEVFKAGIRAYRNLYIIHWMSNGNDMMKLHLLAEEMYEELIKEIDTIGELLVEKCGTVPQLDFPCDYVAVQNYDFQTGLDHIQSLINMYIDCIDCAYPNQTSDVQSTLDEWLRYWNKEMNYFVKRQEV